MCVDRHIDKVMNPQPPELIQQNQLRLKATIEVVRLLAKQALAFRGDDESAESSNHGNVIEVVDSYGRMNEEVAKLTLEKCPPKCYLYFTKDSKRNSEFVRERLLHVVSVSDTCAATLKSKIDNVHTEYNLQVENLRGEEYDGASNMRGEWNGLQALFLQKCPYAYYRVSELKSIQEVEVVEQIAVGELETRKGANQTCNLQRAGDNGLNGKIRGKALGAFKALRSFDFVFCLLLLDKTMGITNALYKSLQEQSQEITNAMNLVSSMKGRLKKLREDGSVDFFASVVSFCDAHSIDALDISARHMQGTGRLSQQQNCVTIEHYYHVEILNAVIDF
ncbi:uncharacterized protein LOC133732329 [Rosa rugosa]|uniref:uncharacterized protein LOC133732329 n=1 Tax=Rosa rugosa TaxID=74645 RepID=UPI002B41299E|nr:uncharacterized protein LOC133732329 [Rosa rugosa]